MKVIVALDQSQYSEAALKAITNRNWSKDAQFILLSVIDLGLYDHEGWDASLLLNLNEYKKGLLAKRNQYLDSCVESLKRALPTNKIRKKVLQGRPRECIIGEVRDCDPDLLIMGSHGRKGVSKLLLGSVAESVLVEAMCPVEIVKLQSDVNVENLDSKSSEDLITFESTEEEQTDKELKVVIAVQDMNCVNYISEFLSAYHPITNKTNLMLIHACQPATNFNFVDTDGAAEELCTQISTERFRLGKKYINEMYKKIDLTLSTPVDKVKQYIEEGDPKLLIADKVNQWKPDLLILGSHVKTGLKSLGSISRPLVTDVDCSVIVVPLLDKVDIKQMLDKKRKIHIIV